MHAVSRALVIADMPFGSYENGPDEALTTAIRFMKETGCHAVKCEGGERSAKQIKRIVRAGIPVMAHIGFTPQSEHGLGGHIIQGRGDAAAPTAARCPRRRGRRRLRGGARDGSVGGRRARSPRSSRSRRSRSEPARTATGSCWCGATGPGSPRGRIPKFVKQYARIGDTLLDAAKAFREDVESGVYPAPEHEYSE